MSPKIPKRIRTLSDLEVRADADKYCDLALSLGASDAKAIPADKVYVDSRVRVKCIIPRCPAYGGSANCPPHSLETQKVRELVSAFRYATLVRLDVDSSLMVGDDLGVMDKEGKIVATKGLTQLLNRYRKLSDIVTQIESQAFYDGHYLAVAFAAGSCRSHYCNFLECLVLKGDPCRFPLRARPSMEGSGMDAFRMAAEAGWEMYPVGSDCKPADVPRAALLGLVLVD
jgi:predicted metal-binding protein